MSVQLQYLSKGFASRWINCSADEAALAHIEGFQVRELYEHLTPCWIVNDKGELGVMIGERAFFMYKGEAFEYTGGQGTATAYRPVEKREFGESGPISQKAAATPYTGDEPWLGLPLADNISGPRYYLTHPVFGTKQVTKAQWVAEERSAGIYPKCSSSDPMWKEPATNSFNNGPLLATIIL